MGYSRARMRQSSVAFRIFALALAVVTTTLVAATATPAAQGGRGAAPQPSFDYTGAHKP